MVTCFVRTCKDFQSKDADSIIGRANCITQSSIQKLVWQLPFSLEAERQVELVGLQAEALL
jgi:hypothetical protein